MLRYKTISVGSIGHLARLTLVAIMMGMLGLLSGQTQAAPSEDMPIWRVQLAVRVADVYGAETTDSVSVALNGNNRSWLDYARKNFARNDYFTYDLVMTAEKDPTTTVVKKLEDISWLRIAKTGSDPVCIRELMLLVNGKPIYRENFDAPGLWLNEGGGREPDYTVSRASLRSNSYWQNYSEIESICELPRAIYRSEMESRIQSLIGTYMHGTGLYWGHFHGRGVEISKNENQTLHVDLDLAASVSLLPNPEVDVDMDIRVSCSGGIIRFDVENIVADVEILSIFNRKMNLGSFSFTIETGQPACLPITVTGAGDIDLGISGLCRSRVRVTFLSVKVVDNLSSSGSTMTAFEFGINNQHSRYPVTGMQMFTLGREISLPAGFTFTEVTSGNLLRLLVRSNLQPHPSRHPKTGGVIDPGFRQLEVRRQYSRSSNFGRGIHTERSNVNDGYFEITYRIDVEDVQ